MAILGTAAAITGIAGAISSGIGAATADKGQPGFRVDLPPELEAEQLALIQQNLLDFERERQQIQEAVGLLEGIAQTQTELAQGLRPEKEALESLTRQTEQLGQLFGDKLPGVVEGVEQDIGDIRTALSSFDFGTGLEEDIRSQVGKTLKAGREFKDPQVERELEEGRAKLRERLATQFGPGFENTDAGIRALQAFETGATELRFDVAEKGRSNEVARLQGLAGAAGSAQQSRLATLGSRISGRQTSALTGIQFGGQLFQGQQNALTRLGQGIGAQSLGADTLLSARELGSQGLGLADQPFGLLQQFGSQALSGDIQKALRKGGTSFETLDQRFPGIFSNPGRIPEDILARPGNPAIGSPVNTSSGTFLPFPRR